MNDKKKLVVPSLIIVVILSAGAWIAFDRDGTETDGKPESEAVTKSAIDDKTPNYVDSVTLSSTPSGSYVPNEIRVKLGTKIKIEGDLATLVGGMDTMIIDGYNIRKLVAPGDNVVEFVADKPGTFKMYCANGMGNGSLIVE